MGNVAEAQARTQSALAAAVAAQALPQSVLTRAGKLLERLETPARISILGLPGTGKTGILNLLAGEEVVGHGLDCGTIQLVHGDEARTELTLADGTSLGFEGLPDPAQMPDERPVLMRIEAPLPALARIRILELAMPLDPQEQARALTWALRQTDIAVWCTADFNVTEQAIWAAVPDPIKDHAILLRTGAEALGANREAALRVLAETGGPDFAHYLAVSVIEAGRAAAGGAIDKSALRASGAMALISTILRTIEAGQQHAVDEAEILLRKHGLDAFETPKAEAAEPEAAPLATQDTEPQDQAATEQTIAPRDPAEPTIATDAAPAAESAADPATLPEAIIVAFDAAASRLAETGETLLADDTVTAKAVFSRGGETLAWLGERLSGDDLPRHPQLDRMQTMTQDADDLVQLLRIEGENDAAVDAVSAMLQLKRAFQAALAA